MTIKQAFEKLTAVTAAAMKNPFFVMRKLHDAFADIADKVEGGGGGSTVEVTQVVSTGTKIATITVDDTPTDLYAPAASSQDYSTTERVVGKWIDGTTDVYEKTYTFTTASDNNITEYAYTDIMDKVINYSGIMDRGDGVFLSLNTARYQDSPSDLIGCMINNSTKKIDVFVNENTYRGRNCHITVRYTKPTT